MVAELLVAELVAVLVAELVADVVFSFTRVARPSYWPTRKENGGMMTCPKDGRSINRTPGARSTYVPSPPLFLPILLSISSFNLLVLLLAVNVLLLAVLLLAATSLALHLPAFAAGAYAPSYQS